MVFLVLHYIRLQKVDDICENRYSTDLMELKKDILVSITFSIAYKLPEALSHASQIHYSLLLHMLS